MVKLIDVTSHVKTRGRPTVKQMPELLDAGIDVIVNLLPGIDEMMVKWPKLYVHVPMPDGKFVHEGQVNFAVSSIISEVDDHKNVLVHCRAGRNRTGLVVCSYLVARGMSPDEAIEHFRRVRPNGLANPAFEEYIRRLR